MVELIAEPVVPLNRTKVNTAETIGGELLENIQQPGKGALNFCEALPRDVDSRNAPREFKKGPNSEFNRVIDSDQRQSSSGLRVAIQKIKAVLEDLEWSRDPGLIL
jgi:hypothetical protein